MTEKTPEVGAAESALRDPNWRESLLEVMRQVIHGLPDEATLGELIEATRKSSQLAPVLKTMSVRQLIDMSIARPRPSSGGPQLDEDGNPLMDLGDAIPSVIRRRADVPDGDLRLLQNLVEQGPLPEATLMRTAGLASEQVRLLLRNLRTGGLIHAEGSGPKRKLKITKRGIMHLRRNA
jgi:hypothetical protein